MTTKTLDEEREAEIRGMAETFQWGRDCDAAHAMEDLLAEIDALRAQVRELESERDKHALRARVFDACARAEVHQRTVEIPMWRERAEKAEARVRELEAERDDLRAALQGVADVVDPNGDHFFWRKKEGDLGSTVRFLSDERDKSEADLAETRAQLARVQGYLRDCSHAVSVEYDAPHLVPGDVLDRVSRDSDAIDRTTELLAEARAQLDTALTEADATRARLQDEVCAAETQRDETRAQLARLREAVVADEAAEHDFRQWSEAYEAGDASFEDGEAVRARVDVTRTALASALSTPGPTLAEIRREIRREVQVEILARLRAADAASVRLAGQREASLDDDAGWLPPTPGPTLAEIRRREESLVREAWMRGASRVGGPPISAADVADVLRQRTNEVEKGTRE